jgi:glycosyltransferase involved in cell wall biosynthesis
VSIEHGFSTAGMAPPTRPHILIIVQNLPVPLDRRVWLECQALVRSGYEVSVICPKGPGDAARQQIDGVHIYKYRPAPEAVGLAGFALEFIYSWLRTALVSLAVWQRRPFQVIQACNPPDTYWLLARLWRSRGVKFVFDQHDLNPELFLSRFGHLNSPMARLEYKGLLWLERMTYRTADKIISTNESYKSVAMRRGGKVPKDVAVVRSGPDTRQMRPIYPLNGDKGDHRSLVYLGIMGPQDGVDLVLRVMADLVHRRGRRDVHATLLGFGDCLEGLRREATRLNLDQWVTFTGRADKSMIAEHLSAADVGLCPDLKTPLNDVSTMNKTMEYMAYALPSVSFDLVETRVSGGDSVLYVPSGDEVAFADAVERLLDDPELRVEMGLRARSRVAKELDWRPQAERYVAVFENLTGWPSLVAALRFTNQRRDELESDHGGRSYVDLTDAIELRRFIQERSSREHERQF